MKKFYFFKEKCNNNNYIAPPPPVMRLQYSENNNNAIITTGGLLFPVVVHNNNNNDIIIAGESTPTTTAANNYEESEDKKVNSNNQEKSIQDIMADILYGDIQPVSILICVVCGDRASGTHYGAISCEGCKGFFKRSIRRQMIYRCSASSSGSCVITKLTRNRCQRCRFEKCLRNGMSRGSVQSARRPEPVEEAHHHHHQNTPSSSLHPVVTMPTTIKHHHDDDEGGKEMGNTTTITPPHYPPLLQWNNFSSSSSSYSNYCNPSQVTEAALQALLSMVIWAKHQLAFHKLSDDLNLSLLKSSWTDLFTIGLLQCQDLVQFHFPSHHHHQQSGSSSSHPNGYTNFRSYSSGLPQQPPPSAGISEEVNKLQQFLVTALPLNLSDYEIDALKLLALLSPDRGSQHGESVVTTLKLFQSIVSKELLEHISSSSHYQGNIDEEEGSIIMTPNNISRLSDLLLLLPQLRILDWNCLKTLFFADLYNTESMDNHLISVLFHMEEEEEGSSG